MPHVDLLELPYFDGLSMDGLVELVDLMEPVQYQANDLLMTEGDTRSQPLFIATSGRISISKSGATGEERTLAELDSPTLFGEIELFCQLPAVCNIRALTHVAAFTLDRPTFDKLFESNNPTLMKFTFNVARVACHRLAIADELLAQVLPDEDLCEMRERVWNNMNTSGRWATTTGSFKVT